MFFLTNIKHVFWGAQKDSLSETVLLSTHNICFSHQYQACVLGTQKDHLIEMVLLSTHNICFLMRIKWRKWFSNARFYLEVYSLLSSTCI